MKQSVFTLIENEALTARFSLLRLRGDCSAIECPGQFVSLSLPGFFLRRPFSVCDWDEQSFSLIVEEAVKTNVLDTQTAAKQKTPASVIVLSIVCAVLVAALITQSILLRGKLHRLEEERL